MDAGKSMFTFRGLISLVCGGFFFFFFLGVFLVGGGVLGLFFFFWGFFFFLFPGGSLHRRLKSSERLSLASSYASSFPSNSQPRFFFPVAPFLFPYAPSFFLVTGEPTPPFSPHCSVIPLESRCLPSSGSGDKVAP